jgi:hypothetical protein
LDLSVLADSIRLENKIDEMDLSGDLVESFIENINIHCFKRRLIAGEFINIINKVSALSKNLGIPVEHLPDYIEQKKSAGESERRNRRCRNKTTLGTTTLQCNYG